MKRMLLAAASLFAAAVVVAGFLLAARPAAAAEACPTLLTLSLPGARVISATPVPAGSFVAPNGASYNVPAFCRVALISTPSDDSDINIEVWMPNAGWTGRFEGTGNGGYAGSIAIDAFAMVYALQHGVAVAATDMGTAPSSNNDGDSLTGHPQKIIDFGWRATHLMTAYGKQVVKAFYGKAPTRSYFNGCSTGGQQALMEAQRFPDDYDGILGGDPAANRTHVHTDVEWIYAVSHATSSSALSSDQVNLVTSSVLAACVRKSGGVKGDGFLTDPRKCDWQPKEIQCKSALQQNCLQSAQVWTASRIYDGPRDPLDKHLIFPGSVKGSENATLFGWSDTQTGNEPQFDSIFKWVFGLSWQYSDFDFAHDMAAMDAALERNLNANSPDLRRFRAHGGKLLMYHGWADPLVSPQDSIDHFIRVATEIGHGRYTPAAVTETEQFYRLFMVPGMNHCQFGPGPNAFGNQYSGAVAVVGPPKDDPGHHALLALFDWVEKGKAPSQIIATKFVQDQPSLGIQMSRPICPFPEVPRYKGKGNANNFKNFACVDDHVTRNQMPAPEYLK